jgi:hypothetical protein
VVPHICPVLADVGSAFDPQVAHAGQLSRDALTSILRESNNHSTLIFLTIPRIDDVSL